MANRLTPVKRVALLAVAATAVVAVSVGLVSSRATAASPSPASGKVVLKIGWMESPDNMNPFLGWSNNVYEIYGDEYLRFVGRDTKTLKPDSKGVAKSWQVSPDGLTWTFQINQGITWHDGQPLTADDVAFTFNYIVDNDMPILGTATKNIKKAVVVDPYTVKLICTRPKANMLQAWMIVLPKHIWSKLSPQYAGSKFQNPPPVVGNGPWQVVDWKRNGFVRLVANKQFYLGPPKIDEVIFVFYETADAMVEDLKSGNLDAAYTFPPAQYEPLKNTPGVAVEQYTWFNWDYLAFNCYAGKSHGHPVLRDPRFRVALEYAVDRDQLVNVAYNGYAIPGLHLHAAQRLEGPRLQLAASRRRAARLRPRQGQPAARRGRLPRHQRRRHPRVQGQGHHAAPLGQQLNSRGTARSQAHRRLAPPGRRGYEARYLRRRRLLRPHLELRRRHVRARLRHLRLGLGRLFRRRPDARLLHHRADRVQQRAGLVEHGVRPARRGAERRRSTRTSGPR